MASSSPQAHETEISVFGPGIGECIVMHLGEGQWIVVDSCISRKSGKPIALEYLASLGVDVAKQVALVAVTHWHDDHMRGAAQIIEACSSAEFICSAALNNREFKTLVSTSGTAFLGESGIDEFRRIIQVMMRRKASRSRPSASPDKWALEGMVLYRSNRARVVSLSPSHETFTLALSEFARLMPTAGAPKRRFVSQEPNAISIVLWVEAFERRFLLGSDLETGRNPATGWHAVIGSSVRPREPAEVFKVSHHGSNNADHPLVWSDLVVPNCNALITPFRGGSKPLPAPGDRSRILGHTPNAFLSANTKTAKTKLADAAARKLAKAVAPDLSPIESPMGQIRWRAMPGEAARVELFGEARPLSQVS